MAGSLKVFPLLARVVKVGCGLPGVVRLLHVDAARAAKPDPLDPAFVLLLFYGIRRSEVLDLRWQDVDRLGGSWPAPGSTSRPSATPTIDDL